MGKYAEIDRAQAAGEYAEERKENRRRQTMAQRKAKTKQIREALAPEARAVYDALRQPLADDGRWSETTDHAFAHMCECVAFYRQSVETVRALNGRTVYQHPNGCPCAHPAETQRLARGREMRDALRDFGLTPKSMAAMKLTMSDNYDDGLDDL